jgi:hypothetical protein
MEKKQSTPKPEIHSAVTRFVIAATIIDPDVIIGLGLFLK